MDNSRVVDGINAALFALRFYLMNLDLSELPAVEIAPRFTRALPEVSCVYFVLKSDAVFYIGKAIRLNSRWYEPAVEAHACEVESDWTGCYKDSWKGLITPDAFAHPAKFSRSLIHRIYAHAVEEHWLAPGATVIDPFGGVALGGLEAAWHGAHWIGCELESKFVALGQKNIALWQARFGHMPTWGSVQLVQGDSRQLSNVLERAGLVVSSPPFSGDTRMQPKNGGPGTGGQGVRSEWVDRGDAPERHGQVSAGNLGNLPARDEGLRLAIASPPFAESTLTTDKKFIAKYEEEHRNGSRFQGGNQDAYGTSLGQLGAMVVSSPPFAESLASDDPKKRGGLYRDPKRAKDKTLTATYGTSEGQLGAMKDHAGMVVSSPPHEHESYHGLSGSFAEWREMQGRSNDKPGVQGVREGYGKSKGQLAGSGPDNFWIAAREIVAQTYIVLAPNSHAIWVLKGFIRKKTYMDFPDQWRQLCEACGFITLHWHRCWLVEPGDVQGGLLGDDKDYTRERKSFFRRLAEKKGSPRIDFEVVLCTLKK